MRKGVVVMNKQSSVRACLIASVLTVVQVVCGTPAVLAQSSASDSETRLSVINASLPSNSSLTKYFDPQTGITVDQAVTYALEHNGELLAAHKEVDAANALVRQAALRANPKVDASLSKTVTGTDNTITVTGMLPMELGGRRPARASVAERELEMSRQNVAKQEEIR